MFKFPVRNEWRWRNIFANYFEYKILDIFFFKNLIRHGLNEVSVIAATAQFKNWVENRLSVFHWSDGPLCACMCLCVYLLLLWVEFSTWGREAMWAGKESESECCCGMHSRCRTSILLRVWIENWEQRGMRKNKRKGKTWKTTDIFPHTNESISTTLRYSSQEQHSVVI